MRKTSIVFLTGLLFVLACNNARKPSAENFKKAIDAYFATHGKACTSIDHTFPVDFPRSVLGDSSGIGGKMAALAQAGLVSESETTTVLHGMLDALRGPTPPQPIRRYQLTVGGQKYFKQLSGAVGQTGAFCYGQKTVDSIVKWTEPVASSAGSQADVTYTYKIMDLASWAQRPAVLQAFPDIAATVNGISKMNQTIGLHLTSNGWEVHGSY